MIIKSLESLNIPCPQKEAAKLYLEELKQLLGDSLELFMLTGSCGLEKCIASWSDVNVLVVVKAVTVPLLEEIRRIESGIRPAKIVSTILSHEELAEGLIGPELRVAFYQYSVGLLGINYIDDSVPEEVIPAVNFRNVQECDSYIFPICLQRIKYELVNEVKDKRKLISLLYLLMKIYTRSGMFYNGAHSATSYDAVSLKFARMTEIPRIDFLAEIRSSQDEVSSDFLEGATRIVEAFSNRLL